MKARFAVQLIALVLLQAAVSQVSAQTTADAVMQRESIRRQEILLRAIGEIEQTEKLVTEGKRKEARDRLAEILRSIPEQGEGAPVYDSAAKLLSTIELAEARDAMGRKDWFGARDAAVAAIGYDSGNRSAQDILVRANAELGIQNNQESTLNPAVDRKFVENINAVRELIKSAQDLTATGQVDAAEDALNKALQIDPYNVAAAKELKKLYLRRLKAAQVAAKSSRQERLTQTREGWTERIRTERAPVTTSADTAPIRRTTNFAISQKLNNIIIPSVNFIDADIESAANFLSQRTRELDPEGLGVSFLLRGDAARASSNTFSLTLSNVPAGEVLRYISNLAGVKTRIEEYAVFIVALAEPDSTVLISRDFPVRPSFFDVAASAGDAPAGGVERRRVTPRAVQTTTRKDSVREALESRGVSFAADGAAAFYNAATGVLTVRNTQDQIDLVEELVTDEGGETLVVKIDTRLIEINQADLDALVPNMSLLGDAASLAGLPNGGTKVVQGAFRGSTGLSGVGSLKSVDGIEPILLAPSALERNTNPPVTSKFGLSGTLDQNSFRILLEAISQKSSRDLLTAPSIVVNNDAQGTITVAREFYYPVEFDEPQVQVGATTELIGGDITDSITVTAVPAFPTQFEARNVGVVLTVRPKITVDRKRVFMDIKPEITEFDGFINYGSRLFHPQRDANGNQLLVNENVINQPVFSVRTVENAQLEIEDGYTMVLGGLIREDISTVEDKIPILGDIPLIGRAFRSKAEQAIKKNLLIFVSVRILRPDGEPFNPSAGSAAQAAAR